jgi:hypothetical protein
MHRLRDVAWVFAIAVLMTTVMAWPVVRSPGRVIFGSETVGRHHDPFTVMVQFSTGGAASPYRQPLTDDLGVILARAIGPVAAYNAIVLLSFPLAAAAAFGFARYLLDKRLAAGVAAIIFAFSPVHLAHATYHPHIAQVQWLPLYLVALFFCIDRPRATSAILLVAAFAALWLSNFYGGLIGTALTPVALVAYWGLAAKQPRTPHGLWVPLSAVAFASVAGLVLIRVFAPEALGSQVATADADVAAFGARLRAYVMPPVDQAWIGPAVRRLWERAGVGAGLLEQQISIGYGVLVLVTIALWASMTGRLAARTARVVAMLTIVGGSAIVLSLAVPADAVSTSLAPAAMLHRLAPMFRSYARFGIAVSLATAVLAGVAVEFLVRKSSRPPARRFAALSFAAVLVAAIAVEFAPVPWRSRDVLPTAGHRWLADRTSSVRALDCAKPRVAEASVPWLMGGSLTLMSAPFDGCDDPELVQKLAALRYSHLIEREDAPQFGSGVPYGLALVRSFSDARVYTVTAVAPPILVVARSGFFEATSDLVDAGQWMSDSASWSVRNLADDEPTTALEMDLSAFHQTRLLDVSLDGRLVATLAVEQDRRRYLIGPFAVPRGDHTLVFRSRAPATAAGADQSLTIMVSRWRWVAG